MRESGGGWGGGGRVGLKLCRIWVGKYPCARNAHNLRKQVNAEFRAFSKSKARGLAAELSKPVNNRLSPCTFVLRSV